MSDLIKIRASSLPRLELCPGSLRAEVDLPDNSSEVSKSGDKVHLILAEAMPAALEYARDNDKAGLGAVVIEPAAFIDDACVANEANEREGFVSHWFAGVVVRIGNDRGGIASVDVEIGLEAEVLAGDVVLSGHCDVVLTCGDGTVHVVDYKTGFLNVATAEVNIQGQAYGLLVAKAAGLDSVFVHFVVAGNDADERHTFAEYDAGALAHAEARIEAVVERALDLEARRTPDPEACQYCRALAHCRRCPESLDTIKALADLDDVEIVELMQMHDAAESIVLPPGAAESICAQFELVLVAEKAAAKYRDRLKEYLKTFGRLSVEGLKMGDDFTVATPTTTPACREVAVAVQGWIDADAFDSCTKPSLPKIIAAAQAGAESLEGMSKKDSKEFIVRILDSAGALTKSARDGKITLKKKAPADLTSASN